MIHVDRTHPGPAILVDTGAAGDLERTAARKFFAIEANREASYEEFKVYKDATVKAALQAMFHGKCAYCEFPYIGGMPVDVEHFRPKGAVVHGGKLSKPAYYWLAAAWGNLLPSCIDCNRKREQDLQDGAAGKVGKANLFPLEDEAMRARNPGDEANEKALLLDPCNKDDEPSEHLEFRDDGWIVPRANAGKASPRGAASIEVFGLARMGLVQLRAEAARVIVANLTRLRRQLTLMDRYPGDPDIEAEFIAAQEALREAMEPASPFSAMARQIIEPVLRDLGFPLP